ncbi:hypothetical protein F2Q65_00975 [Thiohalocapsa marina]|uniref:Uncharacterized protein n=1 Tax=Thiohalocapsa marina TaxID=424902 RepID=A0A5M8FVJ5_9GAMM|nr:hypothetical protein [Thiohalocapsa marina]KAA6187844.1 hypothetical protein F2Q65_00975 [Thiohalocapsa marina]
MSRKSPSPSATRSGRHSRPALLFTAALLAPLAALNQGAAQVPVTPDSTAELLDDTAAPLSTLEHWEQQFPPKKHSYLKQWLRLSEKKGLRKLLTPIQYTAAQT